MVDEKAYGREFKPFNKLNNENQKIIITTDDIDDSTSKVKHIKFSDFIEIEDL